jgi:hypothetical protein
MKQKYTATLFAIFLFMLLFLQTLQTRASTWGDGDPSYKKGVQAPTWDFFAYSSYQQIQLIVNIFATVTFYGGLTFLFAGLIFRAVAKKNNLLAQAKLMIRWAKILTITAVLVWGIGTLTIFLLSRLTGTFSDPGYVFYWKEYMPWQLKLLFFVPPFPSFFR